MKVLTLQKLLELMNYIRYIHIILYKLQLIFNKKNTIIFIYVTCLEYEWYQFYKITEINDKKKPADNRI